ncbi:MAG TPA: hypothetical protein VGL94_03190, partial [Ktedonobacteraceae bacterium]
ILSGPVLFPYYLPPINPPKVYMREHAPQNIPNPTAPHTCSSLGIFPYLQDREFLSSRERVPASTSLAYTNFRSSRSYRLSAGIGCSLIQQQ